MHILFVPGEIVAREHCFDRVKPLVKHGPRPLVVADRPWKGPGIYWPSFLYDEEEGLFKMWYFTLVGEFGKHKPARQLIDNAEISGQHFLCYACSRDGLRWEKPALGIVHLKDHPDTNILFSDSGFLLGCATVICKDTRRARDNNPLRALYHFSSLSLWIRLGPGDNRRVWVNTPVLGFLPAPG